MDGWMDGWREGWMQGGRDGGMDGADGCVAERLASSDCSGDRAPTGPLGGIWTHQLTP